MYKSTVPSRKSSLRPNIQVSNGKAWKPSITELSGHKRARERGRSIGVSHEMIKRQNLDETSFCIGNASMLNSSFQKNKADQSMDYLSYQDKAYLNGPQKRESYGGESMNKRGRGSNMSPERTHKTNLKTLLSKVGNIKC